MKKLKILTIDKDLKELRQDSQKIPLKDIKSEKIQKLIKGLIYTAENTKLTGGWETAGLAAPQVGEFIQLFVSKDLYTNEFRVYINPELKIIGSAKDINIEGCLSVPGVEGNVERFKKVRVKYYDINGRLHKEELRGFDSRIFQHEHDHLHGILFIDKVI